jgi:hypothetical protein
MTPSSQRVVIGARQIHSDRRNPASRSLLEQQKAGKTARQFGKVDIPQEPLSRR